MYANKVTESMDYCIKETKRRRTIQEEYNKQNNITPKTIIKKITEPIRIISQIAPDFAKKTEAKLSKTELKNLISSLTKQMNQAAKEMDFEKAANYRDMIFELKAEYNY